MEALQHGLLPNMVPESPCQSPLASQYLDAQTTPRRRDNPDTYGILSGHACQTGKSPRSP